MVDHEDWIPCSKGYWEITLRNRLHHSSRPYKRHYFANKKVWMNSDVMTDILTSLNRRLQLKQGKIMLFVDNDPCHPAGLQDKLSKINIVFFPKNTTSKTQPLDSGIIASWKCRYKKRLRHVCSKVGGSNSANDIVKSVNLLVSSDWVGEAGIGWCLERNNRQMFQKNWVVPWWSWSFRIAGTRYGNGSILYCRRVFSDWRWNSNMLWSLWPRRSKMEGKGKRRIFEESGEHFRWSNTSKAISRGRLERRGGSNHKGTSN